MVRWLFPCEYCHTSGGNTLDELLEHQIRRGHWLEYFAGRKRSTTPRGSYAAPSSATATIEEVNGVSEEWEAYRSCNNFDEDEEEESSDEDDQEALPSESSPSTTTPDELPHLRFPLFIICDNIYKYLYKKCRSPSSFGI